MQFTQTMQSIVKKGACCLLLSLLLTGTSYAQITQSHREAAEELLLITETDKLIQTTFDQIKQMAMKQFPQSAGGTPKEQAIQERYRQQLFDVIQDEFSWAKMKDQYIDIYVKTYSESEIKEISQFFKTDAGQVFIKKMPDVMQQSMAVSQQRMPAVMMKVMEITQAMSADMNAQ